MTYKVTAAQQAAIDKLMASAKEVLRLFPDALTVDGSAFGSVDGFEAFEDICIRLSNGAYIALERKELYYTDDNRHKAKVEVKQEEDNDE